MKSIKVSFDNGALEVIDRLKAATDCDSGQVIRDALSLYDWARRNHQKRIRVGSFDQHGNNCIEVLLPFR